jgi:dolichol-phosphate mannosyltransferase
MKVAVVIAAYDEEETIGELVSRLQRAFEQQQDVARTLLFVVEGEDRTREILATAAATDPTVIVHYHREPSGLGAAFERGFAAVPGDCDYVVTMDADLNHQPEEIDRLLRACDQLGVDIVIGSRFVDQSSVAGTPLWKRLLSGLMNRMMSLLYGLQVKDKTSGFRVYRAASLRRLDFRNRNFAFLPEMLIRANALGMSMIEVPIEFIFRRRGESKLRFWTTVFSYLALLRSRFTRWTLVALAVLSLGTLARAWVIYPVHRYPQDADRMLTGMTALEVLLFLPEPHSSMQARSHCANVLAPRAN